MSKATNKSPAVPRKKPAEPASPPAAVASKPVWFAALHWLARLACIAWALREAFVIRMYAINEYGRVIHEFDPWFNFRATQYLADNGWDKFFKWFDYMSWYPLGRPVGTTIYPGMQITSVAIWNVLAWAGYPMSLNDVCCLVPAWFGVLATALLGLLTYECSSSVDAGVGAALVMSIIPAHIMRSVGGGYDNESVAVTAMCLTFYLWCRSLRGASSWWIGVFAGLAEVYMAAVWGGYVFVINLVGFHAALLSVYCLFQKEFDEKLHKAYSLFYVIATFGSTRVPVIGWTPLKSLEQVMPLLVFLGMQVLAFVEWKRKEQNLSFRKVSALRLQYLLTAGAALALVAAVLFPTGYFGPLSSRVRGLFVKHTRTGNPLVDSVAEHQPASPQAYWQFLHYAYVLAPVGLVLAILRVRTDAMWFLVVYSASAYFFSAKMMRLVLLAGPVAAACTGVVFGFMSDALITAFFPAAPVVQARDQQRSRKSPVTTLVAQFTAVWTSSLGRLVRVMAITFLCLHARQAGYASDFYQTSHAIARQMSNPQIMFKGQLSDGTTVMVDDYREAYQFLRDKTPKDSRVLAWWDYGYQITGIANRTTIADGNTWNHEHIATLGRALTSPLKDAHRIVRHLADYVLIWTGGGGDDLAKSPHMARIGNSVFHDICPGDPTCAHFGFDRQGAPTPTMRASLLYVLHRHKLVPGVEADSNRFEEVFSSKYGKVRIFKVKSVDKKSKKWVANPKNRVCDAPGSWYCTGQYPPALKPLIEKRSAFKQLEDFNVQGTEEEKKKAEEYQKQYMSRMGGH